MLRQTARLAAQQPRLSRAIFSNQPLCRTSVRYYSSDEDNSQEKSRNELHTELAKVDRSLLRQLPFEDYIKARNSGSRWGLVLALPGYITGSTAAAMVFSQQYPGLSFDSPPGMFDPILGQDPLMMGLFGCFVSGITTGIVFSQLRNVVFKMMYPSKAAAMKERETDFRLRIMLNRRGGDAFSDDFYGDKVKTLSDYRKWLRHQYTREATEKDLSKEAPLAQQ